MKHAQVCRILCAADNEEGNENLPFYPEEILGSIFGVSYFIHPMNCCIRDVVLGVATAVLCPKVI
jgi:hypothetical protein